MIIEGSSKKDFILHYHDFISIFCRALVRARLWRREMEWYSAPRLQDSASSAEFSRRWESVSADFQLSAMVTLTYSDLSICIYHCGVRLAVSVGEFRGSELGSGVNFDRRIKPASRAWTRHHLCAVHQCHPTYFEEPMKGQGFSNTDSEIYTRREDTRKVFIRYVVCVYSAP